MLGSDLAEFLGAEHEIMPIDKDNYADFAGSEFDVLVNANGNSRRFWANEHPFEDFEASTISVYRSLSDFRFERYFYISSSDAYENHSGPASTSESEAANHENLSPYGLHKRISEEIVRNRTGNWVILRSSMILGKNPKKGPFFDIASGNSLFITPDSRLQLITTKAIAEIISLLIEKGTSKEIFNMGGQGAFSFEDAGKYFEKLPEISPEAEKQEYEMNVAKLAGVYPLKTSEEYLKDFLSKNK